MLYLILAVISSASMALALRISKDFSSSHYGLLAGNYLTCLLLAFLFLPEKNLFPAEGMTAVGAGMLNGLIFLLALIFMQRSIAENGAVLSAAFAKMGILLPIVGSILFLKERPSLLQALGIVLAVSAILVLNLEPRRGRTHAGSSLLLLLLFFFNGMADGMSKVFEQIGERRFDALFLFYTFLTAFVLTVLLLLQEQHRNRRRRRGQVSVVDLVSGMVVGIPNYFSSALLLAAVMKLPAYLVYPCYSVGTILLVSFVSVVLLGDRLTKRQRIGSGLILAALVLLNI